MAGKKIKQYLLCAGFFVFILGLPVSYIWTRHYVDTENYQNRPLAERPEISLETIEEFPTAFENYFNDHLPYKNQLTKMINQLQYTIFQKSASDKVIIGKEGWLFYNTKSDGAPMEQYLGRELLSEAELAAIAESLTLTEQYLAQKGIEFVVLILPNKERVYYDMLPDRYIEPAEICGITQVVEYLSENTNIRLVYPYEEMMQIREEFPDIPLYFHSDTHWNRAGAYVGTSKLLEELGIETTPFEKLTLEQNNYSNWDLAYLIQMQKKYNNDVNYGVYGYPNEGTRVYEIYDKDTKIISYNEYAKAGKLFMIRDSFGQYMSEYLAAAFSETYTVHREVFKQEMIEEYQPDVVVIELVERYVDILSQFRFE